VWQVAEAAGSYRLNVKAKHKGAPAGDYEIRVVELRAATEKDLVLQEARKLHTESQRLSRAGKYDESRPAAERALELREKALGPESPDIAQSLNNLALIYRLKGDYAKAEPMFQRALDIYEKAFGPESPDVAHSLNSLADLYGDKGDYAKAEPMFQRALTIREKALGPESPDVAQSLNSLAIHYYDKGDYAKAEQLYQRSLAIREKALGPDHPDVAHSLNNLALNYREKGDFAKAELMNQRALAIREKALGPEHPHVATSLNNLASNYRDKGDYAKAEQLYQRSLAIWEKSLGPDHPDVAESLNLIARLYEAKGDLTLAVTFQSRANEVSERNIALNLGVGSERQKLAYLTTLLEQTDQIISLHARSAPDDSTARSLAATIILQRKGRVLDAMSDSIEALRRAASPQYRALFDQLKDIRSQQARLVFGGLQRTTPAEYQSQIRNLAEQAEKLEDEISRRSDRFRAEYQPVTLAAVQSAIPARAALIEFYSYHPFNAKSAKPAEAFGQPRYVAYVLRQQGEVQWVDLGEAVPIDRAVTTLRQALGSPNRPDVKQLARALDEKVMRPVRKLVGDIRTLLLSPDGALNLIPFGALVDEQKRYLIESYSFTYLTSGRDLLRLQAHTPSQQGPVVVANPLFDLGDSAIVNNQMGDQRTESRRSIDFTRLSFDPLPGAEVEAKALGAILPEAKILTGAKATEAAIKQVRGPLILHVATHGFFLADRKLATPDGTGLGSEEGAAGLEQTHDALTENPLLRAGLILAGIKQNQSGPGEDGVLTALEAAELNLWETKLVTLSACDTGLGEVKNGDGVYGLRRALALAGSESQVMSLWQVADKATRELMVGYYTGLQRGEGRSEALRNVQLQMLRSRERRHPYYWAGFIQSGEWANLEGKR
jgi:CHAT domain-containing protein/Tfp pilus assembly protein PilF